MDIGSVHHLAALGDFLAGFQRRGDKFPATFLALDLGRKRIDHERVRPKEALAQLKLQKGDTVFLTDAPGGFRLTSFDPAFEAQMTAARAIMKRRRNVLRELAK